MSMEITKQTAKGLICIHRIQYACRVCGHIVDNMKGREKVSLRAIAAGIRYALEVIECTLILRSIFWSPEIHGKSLTTAIPDSEHKRQIMGMDWGTEPDPVAIVVVDARDFRRAVESTSEFPSDGRPLIMVRDLEHVRGRYFSEVIPMKPHYTRLTPYQERRFDELLTAAEMRIRPKKDLSPSTRDTWPPESEQFFNPNPKQVFTKRKK